MHRRIWEDPRLYLLSHAPTREGTYPLRISLRILMISPAALFINVLLTAAALLAVFARFVILAILLWAGNGHVVQDDLTACVIALVFVLSWFFAWYPDWLRREIAARAFPGRYARRGLRIAWLNAYLLLLAASYLGLS